MDGNQDERVDEWRRFDAALETRAAHLEHAVLSYNALVLVCGHIEMDDDRAATASEGVLLRFGQHRAGGLRRLYEDRYGVPVLLDASGARLYEKEKLLELSRELRGHLAGDKA